MISEGITFSPFTGESKVNFAVDGSIKKRTEQICYKDTLDEPLNENAGDEVPTDFNVNVKDDILRKPHRE